jgi:hypothetical protein
MSTPDPLAVQITERDERLAQARQNAVLNETAKAPGSFAALQDGCMCPRMDNGFNRSNHVWPEGDWWVVVGPCPLHGFES